jgi:predicted RNA-binding Zn-ribbon protein involved in translation (DUF1610 family)
MSTFQFPKSIITRPVYGRLSPRVGTAHLMMADAEGAEALLDMAQNAPDLMARAQVFFIQKGTPYIDRLKATGPMQLYIAPSYAASVSRLRKTLQDAHMGLQIYLAGTEGMIGQALNEAMAAGHPMDAIQTEHRGSVARRMQCVHCKGITEDVIHDPFVCAQCGLNLFVRDHYSRRIAAFQGVNIDAEDPGRVPAPVERFR